MNGAGHPHRLDAAALAEGLSTRRVGRSIIVHDELDSTNAAGLELLSREGAACDGWVIFAEHQTAGRGRLGRNWESPAGASLMFSVLLLESALDGLAARLMMAGAIGVADGVLEAADVHATIRWPNDLHVGPRKLAGILVEARTVAAAWGIVVGVGINCLQHEGHFPLELRDRATSLEMVSPHAIDRTATARAVLRHLDRALAADDDTLAAQWRERSADLGARATLVCDGREYAGTILDIHPVGGLLLQLDGGGRRQFDAATTLRPF